MEIYLKTSILKVNMDYKQIAKFTAIGLSGAAINLIALYLIVEFIKLPYIIGAIISYILGITNNFFWNKYWTFNNKSSHYREQYIKYFLISLSSLAVNLVILSILVELFSLWYMISQVIAIIFAGANNYVWNKKITFKE